MKRRGGDFSDSLLSLELQISSLFDGVGGADLIALIDTLSCLTQSEQERVLALFQGVAKRIVANDLRIMTEEERELKALEDSLVASLEREMFEDGAEVSSQGMAGSLVDDEKVVRFRAPHARTRPRSSAAPGIAPMARVVRLFDGARKPRSSPPSVH